MFRFEMLLDIFIFVQFVQFWFEEITLMADIQLQYKHPRFFQQNHVRRQTGSKTLSIFEYRPEDTSANNEVSFIFTEVSHWARMSNILSWQDVYLVKKTFCGTVRYSMLVSLFSALTFAGRTTFLRRRWRTGVFLYPRAIICKIKWVKVEKILNDYMIYGMWIAKIDGVKMRTLPHTHFLQTKHFWHHYFEIYGFSVKT